MPTVTTRNSNTVEISRVGTVLTVRPASWVIGETPSGVIDNVNTRFVSLLAFNDNQIRIFLNGLRVTPSDFTIISNTEIELHSAPIVGDVLLFDYVKA